MNDDPGGGDGTPSSTRRLVLNPTSGRGEHVDRAHRLAEEHGFDVVETEGPGHATGLARDAVDDGVSLLGVCGGDGTLHEVVVGLHECGGLDSVTVFVVPAGTENFVARDVGVDSMEAGFELATGGETRRIDLGIANEEPFVMSAITGLPADASAAATHELKRKLGPLAFVVGAVREGLAFDGLRVDVDAHTPEGPVEWSGEVLSVLVGNVRGFSRGGGQADAEDGLLEVAIVEAMPVREVIAEAAERRLLGDDTPHVTVLRARGLDLTALGEESVAYSLDGEIREFESVAFGVNPGALQVVVGPGYAPDPDSTG